MLSLKVGLLQEKLAVGLQERHTCCSRRRCGDALLQAQTQLQRQELLAVLLRGIATDLLPDRHSSAAAAFNRHAPLCARGQALNYNNLSVTI